MVNKPHFADSKEESAWILREVVADGALREKLISALLDKREFPAGHIGERQYRDETNEAVRGNIAAILTEAGLRKFWAEHVAANS